MSVTSRERLAKTLNHEDPGGVVVEFGATLVSGIHAEALTLFIQHMGWENRRVKIQDLYFLLGIIDDDLLDKMGIDVVGIDTNHTVHGYERTNWKSWAMPSGIEVDVPGTFAGDYDEEGCVYLYPYGDMSAEASSILIPDGFFFDNITRTYGKFDPDTSSARHDFRDDCKVLNEKALRNIEERTNHYYHNTEYGILCSYVLLPAGDMGVVQGPGVKRPEGLRDPMDWLIAYYTAPNYIKDCFEYETEIALKNAALIHQAAGDKIQVMQLTSTDFGTQRAPFISPDMYREFYYPYHKRVNDWIHKNTAWKSFLHSCGSVYVFLEDFYKAGFDILNPVQYTAVNMDAQKLKDEWGEKFVFWGGGVDTQNILAFGTPEQVYEEVKKQLNILAPGGGYVFNAVHNVQGPTKPENLKAMFCSIADYNNNFK